MTSGKQNKLLVDKKINNKTWKKLKAESTYKETGYF